MKRTIALCLALCLMLCACGEKPQEEKKTPEELAQAYSQAITAARDEEMNQYFPVMTNAGENDPTEREMVFSVLGFAPEDVTAYGVSLSLMNVNAYAIAAVMPAEGKEETVKTGLENYVESQKSSFEFYLEDQFAIASGARVETLDDGTLLLVMTEDQDTVLESIKTSLGQ